MGQMWGQKARRTVLAQRAYNSYNMGTAFRWGGTLAGIGAVACFLGKVWPGMWILGAIALLALILCPIADSIFVRNSDDTFSANLYKNHLDVDQATANRMARRKNRL